MSAPEGPDPLGASFAVAMLAQMPSLRSYAAGLTDSPAEAEDLVQDALVRVWRYRRAFQPRYSLRGWMFRVMRNEFLSQRRLRQPWVEDIDGRLADQLSCPPDQEWSLQRRDVMAALATLTRPNREALLLVALGASYAEAAAWCGCEIGAIKLRVHRARARLAKLIGGEEYLRQPRKSGARRRAVPRRETR
jgi:RNA polymerase sigma-70 factor (ECF subfamily)